MKLIVENFQKLLDEELPNNKLDLTNDKSLEQYVEIIQEIEDLTKGKVECLDEEQTDLLREKVGFYNINTNIASIAMLEGTTAANIKAKLHDITWALYCRIIRGCVSLKEAVKNNEVSKKDILSCPIEAIDIMNERMFVCLDYYHIKTLGELTDFTTQQISNSLAPRDYSLLYNYMLSIGLRFENEQADIEFKEVEEKEVLPIDKKEALKSLQVELNLLKEKEESLKSIQADIITELVSQKTNKKRF